MPYRYWTLLVSLLLLLVVSGCQQRSLNDGPTTIHTGQTVPVDECPVPDPSIVPLRINELMIENQSTIPTQDNDYLPWIELYNTGAENFDLGGVTLSDDLGNPDKWQFPCDLENSLIPPGGFRVLFFEGTGGDLDNDRIDFNLPLTDFTLVLNGSVDLFAVNPAALGPDEVIGLFPDGEGDPANLQLPTPGEPNADKELPPMFVRGDLDLNEVVNQEDLNLLEQHFDGAPIFTLCPDRLDVDDNGLISVSDLLFLAKFLDGIVEMPMPYPNAGLDPTADSMNCEGP